MKKGDIVKFKTIVEGYSDGKTRVIRKLNVSEQTGVVLGYSFINTGNIVPKGYYYDEQHYLSIKETHKVLVVEPMECYNSWGNLTKSERYLKPVRCLENDLELIK